ncbi:hypothetical protein [Consotaella aegiceratis]|uniref:hypothetical protein n=1 Tax=Consotaella aegiceratis TaxID=3097961 RepID=UPI002F3F14FD
MSAFFATAVFGFRLLFSPLGVALLLFTPLAVVYAIRKAAKVKRRLIAGRSRAVEIALALVSAGVVAAAMTMAFLQNWQPVFSASDQQIDFYTGHGLADVLIWLVLAGGAVLLALFFVSVPFVMGNVGLVIALVLDGMGIIDIEPAKEPKPGEPPTETAS